MSVEDSAAVIDTAASQAVTVESNDETELGAIWDKLERDNGAERGDNGKFVSGKEAVEEPAGEGGEGEDTGAADTSTPAASVPLPSNWRGLEDTWSKIPDELRETIKAHEDKLHSTLSQQGQQLSAYKPIGEAIQNYAEYFDGRVAQYKPAEAIEYLFNIQRQMDANPIQTLLQIADTYELRPQLQQLFGGTGEGQTGSNEPMLLSKIKELEGHIRGMADPSKIDTRIEQKFEESRVLAQTEDVFSRVLKDVPLGKEVADADLQHFIGRAWAKLGDTASQEAVLRTAYDMAINADPDLRAKSAAQKGAAVDEAGKVAAAKRATQANIKSTSTGKARDLTDDEMLGNVWDKNQKG